MTPEPGITVEYAAVPSGWMGNTVVVVVVVVFESINQPINHKDMDRISRVLIYTDFPPLLQREQGTHLS
jgi:hypothetical protein